MYCGGSWKELVVRMYHTLASRNPTATPSHSSAPSISRTFCSTSWVSSSIALPLPGVVTNETRGEKQHGHQI